MNVETKIAAAALRGVLEAVEADPALAGEVLARVLGATAARSEPKGSAAAAIEAPRPARAARPSRALPPQKKKRHGPKVAEDAAAGERLVDALVVRYGTLAAAAGATGERLTSLRRWKNGRSRPTPDTVRRLEQLVAGPVAPTRGRDLRGPRGAAPPTTRPADAGPAPGGPREAAPAA